VPKEPPATGRVGKRDIVRVTAEKVTVVKTIGWAVSRSEEGLR
jgi:hypothetical protein